MKRSLCGMEMLSDLYRYLTGNSGSELKTGIIIRKSRYLSTFRPRGLKAGACSGLTLSKDFLPVLKDGAWHRRTGQRRLNSSFMQDQASAEHQSLCPIIFPTSIPSSWT